jgi:Ca2+:H+ antiporter
MGKSPSLLPSTIAYDLLASLKGRMHSENRKPSFRRDAASESTPLLRNGTNGAGSGQNPDSTRVLNQGDGRNWAFYPKHVLSISWQVLASNYVNVFLVFVPLGIISGVLKWGPIAIFTLNFIAIIPLAGLLSFATEELSAEMGETIGGLCNASFGNAVELIVRSNCLVRGLVADG